MASCTAATPSRGLAALPVRRSPRLQSRVVGSKRHGLNSDVGLGAAVDLPPSKLPRLVSPVTGFLDMLLASVHGTGELNFTRGVDDTGSVQLLVGSSRKLNCHEPAGYVPRLRVVIRDDGKYQLQVRIAIQLH